MRVCHIVESIDHGAIENWLTRTLSYAKQQRQDIDWTFYCTWPVTGRRHKALIQQGGQVIQSPVDFGQTKQFLSSMRAFLKANQFDILHCHHDFMSGFYLWAAMGLPIKKRFVHVHNTDEALPTPSRWKHALLLEPLRRSCLHLADGIVGIADHVLDQFLRYRSRRPGKDSVCYYGVDLHDIQAAQFDPARFRNELGLPAQAKILLFIGRVVPLKNPVFVVDVLKAVLNRQSDFYAVFAGEGVLSEQVRQRAEELGIQKQIRMLGWRNDSAYVMKNSDVFVFPRPEQPKEGLGLVVVEAQACGLPTITTPGICDDAIVSQPMVERIPLAAGPDAFADTVLKLTSARPGCDAKVIDNSRFGMKQATQQLLRLYNS